MFSESSTVIMQLPCCPGKEGELSEICLQNLWNDLMAESVCTAIFATGKVQPTLEPSSLCSNPLLRLKGLWLPFQRDTEAPLGTHISCRNLLERRHFPGDLIPGALGMKKYGDLIGLAGPRRTRTGGC